MVASYNLQPVEEKEICIEFNINTSYPIKVTLHLIGVSSDIRNTALIKYKISEFSYLYKIDLVKRRDIISCSHFYIDV